MNRVVSAVFDNTAEAEQAVSELRRAGVREGALSVIAQREGASGDYGEASTHEVSEGGADAAKGAIGGAAAGALLGIAALAIPGVGPFVAAGAIAASAVPAAAAIGAAAGAVAGGVVGMLKDHGVSEDDARYYEDRISSGGVFVSVDTTDAGVDPQTARDILYRSGGHSADRAKVTATL